MVYKNITACIILIACSADALYEVTQKRTFLLSILLGSLNIPFLIEVVVLYRRLGPSKPKSEEVYTQLKEPAQEP